MNGVAFVFDSDWESGWRSDMDVMLVATWDGKKGCIYTDISMSERTTGCPVLDLEDFEEEDFVELIGHNLHSTYGDGCFDLLSETKKVSAPILQNEGKRFTLHDLARWNKCRSLPVELVSTLRRKMAWRKGQHIKVARWALEDARLCYDVFSKVKKTGRVRFLDVKTGKKPYAEVCWGFSEEE